MSWQSGIACVERRRKSRAHVASRSSRKKPPLQNANQLEERVCWTECISAVVSCSKPFSFKTSENCRTLSVSNKQMLAISTCPAPYMMLWEDEHQGTQVCTSGHCNRRCTSREPTLSNSLRPVCSTSATCACMWLSLRKEGRLFTETRL